jgi:hypothetical protein
MLKIAGSSLGFKHSEETLAKLSAMNKGENHPSFGKTRSEDIRAKISASNPNSLKIEVTDLYLNSKTTYNSMHEAARTLSILQCRISTYLIRNQKKPYKGRYIFSKI